MNGNSRWNFGIAFLSSHSFYIAERLHISWEVLWTHPLWLAAPGFNLNWHSPEFSFGLQNERICQFISVESGKRGGHLSALIFTSGSFLILCFLLKLDKKRKVWCCPQGLSFLMFLSLNQQRLENIRLLSLIHSYDCQQYLTQKLLQQWQKS